MMLSKLASEKFNNPSAKIDWNLVPWAIGKRICQNTWSKLF